MINIALYQMVTRIDNVTLFDKHITWITIFLMKQLCFTIPWKTIHICILGVTKCRQV